MTQDDWIMDKLFFCVFLVKDRVEGVNMQKKNEAYPAILTKQALSIKKLLYGKRKLFLVGRSE